MAISEATTLAFCNKFFAEDRLSSLESVESAIQQFDQEFYQRNFKVLLEGLLSTAHANRPLIELVLSSTHCGEQFASWIIRQFPETSTSLISSLPFILLDRLSLFLLFLPFAYEQEVSRQLSSYRLWVELAPKVLDSLSSSSFRQVEDADTATFSDAEDDNRGHLKQKSSSQRQRKRARKTAAKAVTTFNVKAFEGLGLVIPSSSREAYTLCETVLGTLKTIFKFYLETLRLADVAATVKRGLLPNASDFEHEGAEQIEQRVTIDNATNAHENPTAYPIVQPMKAALYFDSAVGFGEWRILISTRADRNLREARRKDAKFFKIVIKKIKELSNGHFSDDNQKRLNGPQTEIPIYEAKMTRDSRLVYQVDSIPEYDSEVERQVLKIFGIYTHAQIDRRFWDSMGHQLGRKGKEYRHRCTFRNRPHHTGDNVVMPACFPPQEKTEVIVSTAPELPKEDLEEIHSLLVLEKFVTFSQALLNSMLADLDVAHVFSVTPQEKEIIEHQYSCYVLGRSGTGKTTTMLFKMLGIERAFELKCDSMPKPRQLFVTQSRVLATKVEEYFSKLLESLSTAGRSPQELLEISKKKKALQEEEGLVDVDDEMNWRPDLPSKFSHLTNEHFPLFLTFDRLAKLLEADISEHGPGCEPLAFGKVTMHMDVSQDTAVPASGKLITYTAFLESYWPHFSQSLTKGLDPSLVFGELMGVLQGSEETLGRESNFLDKYSYESLSHRTQYAFANQREVIYAIFLLYLKRKRLRGDYDAADRTHWILKAFRSSDVPGKKLDYLYVDEAQDNLLIDALLLRSLCRNPDGLFWAGDTAQTISVGSSFRFNDLKAFLFRLEKRREFDREGSLSLQEPPRTFQLAINYRSHGGIVHCAHSVIELITGFWPYAIDILAQERGVVDGSKPVFFSGWDKETVRYEQFLFGTTGNRIEFGAQQCILVRDEVARNELREQVGDIGLIMTLYESKGLEFDDVLLYKFFENSTADLSQWRVVLNALCDNEKSALPAPRFDETRHAGICIELKFLYVAITRARKNLWIVDCSEKSEPMKIFWTSRNQIQNCTPGTDVPRLAVSSSPEEWERSGRSLFQNKRYLQAMHCFERAGLNREVSVAHTYYLRDQARIMPAGGSKQSMQSREKAFLSAAEAFGQCAGAAHNPKEKRAYFRNSADCFEQAGDDRRAAQAYVNATEFTNAVKLYRKCGLFDEAVDIVTSHRPDIHTDVAKSIIDVARLYYYSKNKLEKAGRLFSSEDEELEYLEDYDLDVARAGVLDRMGRYTDAAEIHLVEGRTMDAITLLLKAKEDMQAIQRAKDCILQGLWTTMSFASSLKVNDRDAESTRLLHHAAELEVSTSMLDSTHRDELAMFRAIKSNDSSELRILGQRFASRKDFTSSLLCFDHYFSRFPSIVAMEAHDIADILQDFLIYCRLLQDISCLPDPCNDSDIQKLFGFHLSTEKVFLIPEGTYLHAMLGSKPTAAIIGTNELGLLISEWDLSRALKRCLFSHLCVRVQEENEMCQRAKAFTPCLSYAVLGFCNRRECPRQHSEPKTLTPSFYNDLVRIHLQQILIFRNLHAKQSNGSERRQRHRYWISRLHESICPAFYHLGTLANLDIGQIPEAQKAIDVVKYWARDLLYTNLWPDPRTLTTVYRAASLVILFDRSNAGKYLQGAPLINQFIYQKDFRRGLESQAPCVVHELVRSLQGADEAFISTGILFFKQVMSKRLQIDIGVLCDLLDYICGSIILVRADFVLHNVTLPRSWFVHLLRHIKRRKAETTLIGVFTACIGNLLERLHSGTDIEHLLFENTDLTKVLLMRNMVVARVCRTLCLLGYNINNIELQNDIVKHLRILRIRPHNFYRSYAEARSWGIIVRIVQHSTPSSPMDEMIQLYHESKKPGAKYEHPGVRRVFYKSVDQVPGLLSGIAVPSFMSDLRIDAPVFVPRPQPKAELLEPKKPQETGKEVDAVEEEEEEEEEREVDDTVVLSITAGADSIANTIVLETNVPPSQEQIQAACVFQDAYRRALLRRRKPSKNPTTVQASRASFFDSCLEQSRKMDWPNSYYRILFLGPLPHILVCITVVDTYAMGAKIKTKKRLKEATHQALEDVGARLTEINDLLKEVKRLQKALQPQSPLHGKRDLEELKAHVLEVETLVGRVPPAVARNIQEDLERGLKGIVAVKKPPKAKPKPELCIDDDEDIEYDELDMGEEEVVQEELNEDKEQLKQEDVHENAEQLEQEEVDEKGADEHISIVEQHSCERSDEEESSAKEPREEEGSHEGCSEEESSNGGSRDEGSWDESSKELEVEESLEILWTRGQ